MCGALVWPRRKKRQRRNHEIGNPKFGQGISTQRMVQISHIGFQPSGLGLCIMSLDLQFVDEAVKQIGRSPDAVIPILQAVQDHYGYLPEEALRRVCTATQITPASISGVSTFYDMFRHK